MNQANINNLLKHVENLSNSNNNNNNLLTKPANYYLKDNFDPSRHSMPIQDEYKVAKIVKDVYFTMFPDKNGDTYPTSWINPVIAFYREIRKERAKRLKGNIKTSMKGLNMYIVTASILRCVLISNHVHIPLHIYLHFFNNSLKRAQLKISIKPISLESLEKYRLDTKKGIKRVLFKYVPSCYSLDVSPEDFISYTAFSILKFERPLVNDMKKIARSLGDTFPDSTSPSVIAIGILYIFSLIPNASKVDFQAFGLTSYKLNKTAKMILLSDSAIIQGVIKKYELQNIQGVKRILYKPSDSTKRKH